MVNLTYTKAFPTFLEAMASLIKVSFSAHQSLMDSVGLHQYTSTDKYGDKVFTREIGWMQFIRKALIREIADEQSIKSFRTHRTVRYEDIMMGVVGWYDRLAIRQMDDQWEMVVQFERIGSVTRNAQKKGWTPFSETLIDLEEWVKEGDYHTLSLDTSRDKMWQLAGTIAKQRQEYFHSDWCEVEEAEVIIYRENNIEPSPEMVEVQMREIEKSGYLIDSLK